MASSLYEYTTLVNIQLSGYIHTFFMQQNYFSLVSFTTFKNDPQQTKNRIYEDHNTIVGNVYKNAINNSTKKMIKRTMFYVLWLPLDVYLFNCKIGQANII